MTSHTYTVDGLDGLGATLGKVLREQLQRDVKVIKTKVALEVMERSKGEALRLTNKMGLVDRGLYKHGFATQVMPNGADLYNDNPVAGVIELGRRPNRPGPPFAPIREWVARKLAANGAIQPLPGETMYQAITRVAGAIRWSIHHKGTKPRYTLRKATSRRKLSAYFKDAVRTHLPS